jgi:hypothetical protein
LKELSDFKNIKSLIKKFNAKLYSTHQNRKLCEENGHIFIKKYEEDVAYIIRNLISLSKNGVENFVDEADK